MANMKPQPVTYRPFEAGAVLADGLLAVSRPGGELEAKLSGALFDLADMAGTHAARIAQDRLDDAAAAVKAPGLSVSGGEAIHGRPQDGAAPAGGPGQRMAPPAIREAISAAALKYDVNPQALMRIAEIESSFNPAAKNPNSSGGGLFQFVDDTAAQYGLADRYDPVQAADAAARLMRDNGAYLAKKLGRAPTSGELYLAHQQGAGGAAKLLANPDAPAAGIVGNDAVRLNGGHAGMTAGEFAAKWTAKADGLPTSALGPLIGRTPVAITFTGEAPGLSGRKTAFGRAHDEAVSKAYAGLLEDQIKAASDDIEAKLGDSPEDMAQAFGQMRAAIGGDIPASHREAFMSGLALTERAALRRAQKKRDDRLAQEEKAGFLARGDALNEDFAKASAGLDLNSPDGVTAWKASAARVKDHWREAQARGAVSEAQAADAIARIDGDVAAQFHLAQTEGKSPDDIAAMREEMRKDYAGGRLAGVDARTWGRIDAGLETAEKAARAAAKAGVKAVEDQAGLLMERAAAGFAVTPAERTALTMAAAGLAEPQAAAANDVLDIAGLLRTGPVKGAADALAALKKRYGDNPSALQMEALAKGETLLARAKKAMADDPLAYAERLGAIADTGSLTDAQNGDDMARIMAVRAGAAHSVAARFGVAPRFFKAGEINGIEAMAKADPAKGAEMIAAIIKGSGNEALTVLKSFGRQAPVMAGAGAILAGGGSPDAARDAMAGGGKRPDGKDWPAAGEKARAEQAKTMAGRALDFQPDDAARITGAAERIARKRIYEAGLEADSAEAMAIHERAMHEAAGAIFDGDAQWGGFADYDPGWRWPAARVAVPNFIRADAFQDVIDALTDKDMGPDGPPASALSGLWPVRAGRGYVFVDLTADGPVPLAGPSGKAFVLDLEALAPSLMRRLPQAFR